MTPLAEWLQPWADLYRSSAALQAVMLFGHLAGVFLAGGLAVTTDRTILRVRARPSTRIRVVRTLGRTHGLVLAGIGLVILTGLGQLSADIRTLLPSWIFWLKMLLFATLLLNGRTLDRTGRQLRDALDAAPGDRDPATLPDWSRLRTAAGRSAILWATTALLGVVLTTL